MRIAWFTPFSTHSAIGKYSRVIVEELARSHAVELFVPRLGGEDKSRQAVVPLHWIDKEPTPDLLGRLKSFDVAVYNFGNHVGNHLAIHEYSRCHPGIVVLHDLVMRDYWSNLLYQARSSPESFFQLHDLYYPDLPASQFDESLENADRLKCPLFEPFLAASLGVIVHSKFAETAVAKVTPIPVANLDFPLDPEAVTVRRPARRRNGPVRMISFGHLIRNKMVHAVVDCLGQKPNLAKEVEYLIVGDGEPAYLAHLGNLIRHYQMENRVHLLGRKTDKELRAYLASADFAVNLRAPHLGESSWSLLDSLLSGLPTLVWNHGSYAEYPDRCVPKIASLAELPAALERLVRKRWRRAAMGRAAAQHARERFQTPLYCRRFLEHAERVLSEKPFWSLAGRVGDYFSELHARPEDPWTQRVARELSRLRRDAA
jgi:glycosyltransferase involved in cell wall biosynthesis